MTILATRIQPVRQLACGQFICKRCGIEFTGRPNTHCRDCRPPKSSTKKPSN